jgi:hypothetical protein
MGQFPALSFAIRHGHIEEGGAAAARRLATSDLFTGRDPLGQAFDGYDVKELSAGASTPAESLAVGRVTVSFEGGESAVAELERYWDREARRIESMTGQLVWDYGKGVVLLRGPKSHAIIGRAGGATWQLPGVTAAVETGFVSLIFTPLDDLPLGESKSILITAMARDIQTGARYSEDGKRLEELGGPPLLMEPVVARVRVAGARPATVRPLDVYGVPREGEIEVGTDGEFEIDGRYRTYYYHVAR